MVPPTPTISCPRCGYDLAGTHAANPDAASPTGTCSECGLHFTWDDILSGHLHTPRFSYEHGGWYDLTRFVRTAFRAALGWPLWTRLRMVHEVRVGRLLLFAAALFLLMHVLAASLAIAATKYGDLRFWQPAAVRAYNANPPPTNNLRPPTAPWTPPPNALFFAPNGWAVTLEDVIHLALWPYDTAPGFRLAGGAVIGVQLSSEIIFACLFVQLGTPLLLLCLRQTRRTFRLRKVHILRAMCLGVPFYVLAFTLANSVVGACVLLDVVPAWTHEGKVLLISLGIGVFLLCLVLWWWCFARAYLRAPHALGIAIAGSTISVLLFAMIALALEFQAFHDLIE